MGHKNFLSIPVITTPLRNSKLDPLDFLSEIEDKFLKIEPEVKAFIPEEGRFGRLINEAGGLITKFEKPSQRPALYCLPIGVKDIFHVDGFPTRAGSAIPAARLIGSEANSVTTLRALGALIAGKTVTTEFAYFAPGPTKNPHNLKHTPGGSSSGSAAAVAAHLVPFAFGTQTIGSIIRPASYCGVVGFKPTYNRIPTEGVIPLAPSVDTIGFFTMDIRSALFMAQILCEGWQPTILEEHRPVLGIPVGPYLNESGSEMLDHFDRVCHRLKDSGYQIKEVAAMPDFEDIYERHNLIVAREAALVHQSWFAEYRDLYHPKTMDLIERGHSVKDKEYRIALAGRGKLRGELIQSMETAGIDLWISPPATGPAPSGLDSTGDPVMNLPWTHCGFPAINIPAGQNEHNLPLGLQITAPWNQDETLLRWSLDIEKLFQSS